MRCFSLTAKEPRRMCFSQKNLLPDKIRRRKKKKNSRWCAISGARKCRSRNIMNQIISLSAVTLPHSLSHETLTTSNESECSSQTVNESLWQQLLTRGIGFDVLKKQLSASRGAAYWLSPCKGAGPLCRMMELVNLIQIICFILSKRESLWIRSLIAYSETASISVNGMSVGRVSLHLLTSERVAVNPRPPQLIIDAF